MSVIDSKVQKQTIQILGDLISFRSESQLSNLDLIAYIEDIFRSYSLPIKIILSEDRTKGNIIATLPGKKGEVEGGLIMSGHSDVVPAIEEEWRYKPYSLHQKNDMFYGRGTCDMKGFLAAVLAMLPKFIEAKCNQPIHFAFTYDEEIGCLGGKMLVKELSTWKVKPSMVIVGEPTEMNVVTGHKSCCEYRTVFKGLAGHGSNPDKGVNAVEYATRYINHLLFLKEKLKKRAGESQYIPSWSTLQIGMIHGGIACNVIADHCEVEWELRTINKKDFDYVHQKLDRYVKGKLLPDMHKICREANIEKKVIGEVNGLVDQKKSKLRDMLLNITGLCESQIVSFGTEGGLFQSLGASVVVCGPGSIHQAHKPDEYITLNQLDRCLSMLHQLAIVYK